jgi:hypothetical protein
MVRTRIATVMMTTWVDSRRRMWRHSEAFIRTYRVRRDAAA